MGTTDFVSGGDAGRSARAEAWRQAHLGPCEQCGPVGRQVCSPAQPPLGFHRPTKALKESANAAARAGRSHRVHQLLRCWTGSHEPYPGTRHVKSWWTRWRHGRETSSCHEEGCRNRPRFRPSFSIPSVHSSAALLSKAGGVLADRSKCVRALRDVLAGVLPRSERVQAMARQARAAAVHQMAGAIYTSRRL